MTHNLTSADLRNVAFADHLTAAQRSAIRVALVANTRGNTERALNAGEAGDIAGAARYFGLATDDWALAVRLGATDAEIRAGIAQGGEEAADPRTRLDKAYEDFTKASISEFCAARGLTDLGQDGPLYDLGHVRVRALFRGPDGQDQADAALVYESMTVGSDIDAGTRGYYEDQIGQCPDGHDLSVANRQRGEHDASLAPLGQIAHRFDLPAPVLAADPGGWVRSWDSFPDMSDEQQADAATALGVQL